MEVVTLFLISQIIDISFEELLSELTDIVQLENFSTPEATFILLALCFHADMVTEQ